MTRLSGHSRPQSAFLPYLPPPSLSIREKVKCAALLSGSLPPAIFQDELPVGTCPMWGHISGGHVWRECCVTVARGVCMCVREREPVVLWPNPTVSRPFFTLLLAMKGKRTPSLLSLGGKRDILSPPRSQKSFFAKTGLVIKVSQKSGNFSFPTLLCEPYPECLKTPIQEPFKTLENSLLLSASPHPSSSVSYQLSKV